MESDWRKFRDMLPRLRERYLAEHNARIARLLTDPQKTPTECFVDADKAMRELGKTLHACLDGYSRSNMDFHLILMRGHGMLTREDAAVFSEELQKRLFDRAQ